METLTQKYQALEVAIRLRIASKIMDKGVESKHRSEKVIAIKKDELQFNLEGGRYLTEITAQELIDNEGYSYNLSVLPIDQLCEAVDNS